MGWRRAPGAERIRRGLGAAVGPSTSSMPARIRSPGTEHEPRPQLRRHPCPALRSTGQRQTVIAGRAPHVRSCRESVKKRAIIGKVELPSGFKGREKRNDETGKGWKDRMVQNCRVIARKDYGEPLRKTGYEVRTDGAKGCGLFKLGK